VSRSSIQASDRALLNEELRAMRRGCRASMDEQSSHAQLPQCVRSREQAICHAGVGHRSVTVAIWA